MGAFDGKRNEVVDDGVDIRRERRLLPILLPIPIPIPILVVVVQDKEHGARGFRNDAARLPDDTSRAARAALSPPREVSGLVSSRRRIDEPGHARRRAVVHRRREGRVDRRRGPVA